jgi:REP element-mobilizing transposase RayT
MEDHIHILSDLHPCVALADFIRDMKTSSSLWLKSSGKFPAYIGWADGYAALTYAWRDKERIISYIKNQRIHHEKENFLDEYRRLLVEHNVSINENYFP